MSQTPTQRRRRRKASPVRKLRPFWFLVVLVLALGAIGAYWLLTWPALYPHTIEVSGNRVVPKEQIEDRARINLTQNMWLQNTHAMAARIESIPYIDTASVHRRPPDSMTIAVTERVPYATLRSENTVVTIDRRLRVLQDGPANGEIPEMIAYLAAAPALGSTISNGPVESLAHIIDRAQAANLSVDTVSYDRYDDVTLTLRSGIRVMLGDATDLDRRLSYVEPILTQVQHGSRRISAIDLRAITTPVIVYAK